MSAPTGTAVAARPRTALTPAEAGTPPEPRMVWSPQLQAFVPRGQQFALDRAEVEGDPAFQLAEYDKRRKALLQFIGSELQEAEYTPSGYPVKGAMHDYYILPEYDLKTVTKGGASKVANLLRFRVGKKRVTEAHFTADHGSARVAVELVDADGRPVGAHEAACSTAEKGFQRPGVRCKYGAQWERDKDGNFTKELEPPDYRAAENDVVSRAGKRAFVGAVIVAASLEEIFDLEGSTDAAGEEGSETKPAAPPHRAAAPRAPETKAVCWPFGDKKGTPLREFPLDDLERKQAWCEKHGKADVAREVAGEIARQKRAATKAASGAAAGRDQDQPLGEDEEDIDPELGF